MNSSGSEQDISWVDDLKVSVVSPNTEDNGIHITYMADYYPFGMVMPKREYQDADESYKYGFQGMEKDEDWAGAGNGYTTDFRLYDPRLGRWLSVDPLDFLFPYQSPFIGLDNNPISIIDPLGLAGQGVNGDPKPKKYHGTGIKGKKYKGPEPSKNQHTKFELPKFKLRPGLAPFPSFKDRVNVFFGNGHWRGRRIIKDGKVVADNRVWDPNVKPWQNDFKYKVTREKETVSLMYKTGQDEIRTYKDVEINLINKGIPENTKVKIEILPTPTQGTTYGYAYSSHWLVFVNNVLEINKNVSINDDIQHECIVNSNDILIITATFNYVQTSPKRNNWFSKILDFLDGEDRMVYNFSVYGSYTKITRNIKRRKRR